MSNVFVYGTLMAEEVVDVLIRRQPKKVPARVRGYRRHRIQGFVFPAIVPAGDADEVPGLVLFDLTPREMEIFDGALHSSLQFALLSYPPYALSLDLVCEAPDAFHIFRV